MRRIFLGVLVLVFFACGSEKEKVIFQGDLKDLFIDSLSFERELGVGYMGFHGATVLNGKEVAYTKWNEIFQFFDIKTGRIVDKFLVPLEGPRAIKGMAEIGVFDSKGRLLVTNSSGFTNVYEGDSLIKSYKRDMDSYDTMRYLYSNDSRNAIHFLDNGNYELTFNPFEFMAFRDGRDGLDLDFISWVGEMDVDGNWHCQSNFKAPYDESYSQSSQGGKLIRMVGNGDSWLMFPYSDSLYQIKNCQVINRIKLNSVTPLIYQPEKYEGDRNSGSWVWPEEAPSNLYLIDDISTDLYIRWIRLKEKRNKPEVQDPRKRMFTDERTYLMLIYDSEWNLKGELKMVYPIGTRFENLFSTSEGLFINKPEQTSEDEYEFYKIDLSKFSN